MPAHTFKNWMTGKCKMPAWLRIRKGFTLFFLLLALAFVVFFEGWFYAFKPITVRGPEPSDPIPRLIFAPVWGTNTPLVRKIAVIQGGFRIGRRVRVRSHSVEGGKIKGESDQSIGSRRYPAGPEWEFARLIIGLCIEETEDGWRTSLTSNSLGRGGGGGWPSEVSWPLDYQAISPGRLRRERVIYATGTQQPVIDDEMTLKEFLEANPGNYLVVTAACP